MAFTRAVNLNYGVNLSFAQVAEILEHDEYLADALRAHLHVLNKK